MYYKIAACITAYEDIKALEKCITAIKKQLYSVQKIFIVDNSHSQLTSPILQDKDVIINFAPINIGISGALIAGLQWSISNQYDFLWTFDQDSEPQLDTLKKLIAVYDDISSKGLSAGIIAPLPIEVISNHQLHGLIFKKYKFDSALSKDTNICVLENNYYECDGVITSGSLVSLKAAKNVEMPNEGLFIDAVDWDYCMKFRDKGYSVIVCTDAILKHNFGTHKSKSDNNKLLINPIYCYSALRYYYMCRNHTYIETRLSKQNNYLHISIIYRIYSLIKKIAKVILYEQEQKILKVWACIRGTCDGFIGKLGKAW